MKITDIKIKNYKAFYGEYEISLKGKNLLIYGENGSGKSSLYSALNYFFEASKEEKEFIENIFLEDHKKNEGFVELTFNSSEPRRSKEVVKWDKIENKRITNQIVAESNKIKGFFDYRKLLKTHFIEKVDKINLFDLIIDEILLDSLNNFTTNTFGEEWEKIKELSREKKSTNAYRKELPALIRNFNKGLSQKLETIKSKMNDILNKFNYGIELSFDLTNIGVSKTNDAYIGNLFLKINFHGKNIESHHEFLNEARLTAIGISLYLACVLDNPIEDKFKILVLDDVLIGLDTGNRIPFIDILNDYFSEFQIIFTTYDKTWFELLKGYFEGKPWNFIEMYSKKSEENSFDIPVIFTGNNQDFIVKAKKYLDENDYKASAVYIRSEFEKLIKHYCHKKHLKVKYDKQAFKVDSNSFWQAIKDQNKLSKGLIEQIELYRGIVMNPVSHYTLEKPSYKSELNKTIETIEALKIELK